jgi:hypothetical protein
MAQVTVTVRDEYVDRLDDVVGNLRERGMTVDQVLGSLGIVTGSAPADALGALQGVEGVASVDEQLTHQIAPPDAEIQ